MIRKIDLNLEYEIFVKWWDEWKFPPIPKALLPKTGYVAETEGKPLCATWLYLTNSPIASMAWFISDKQVRDEVRTEALGRLVKGVELKAKAFGCSRMIINIQHSSMASRLKTALGYKRGDPYLQQLEKVIT